MKSTNFLLISILLLSIAGCNNPSASTNETSGGNENKETRVNPESYNTNHFATQILNGTAQPSDNQQTFDCLARLTSNNEDTLDLYFEVYEVILKKSDGALTEVLGQSTMDFIEANPDFFVKRFEEMQAVDKQKMVSVLAYEFYFSENPEQELETRFSNAAKNLKQNVEPHRAYLDFVRQSVWNETQSLLRG